MTLAAHTIDRQTKYLIWKMTIHSVATTMINNKKQLYLYITFDCTALHHCQSCLSHESHTTMLQETPRLASSLKSPSSIVAPDSFTHQSTVASKSNFMSLIYHLKWMDYMLLSQWIFTAKWLTHIGFFLLGNHSYSIKPCIQPISVCIWWSWKLEYWVFLLCAHSICGWSIGITVIFPVKGAWRNCLGRLIQARSHLIITHLQSLIIGRCLL
jgi:hypothetical protein